MLHVLNEGIDGHSANDQTTRYGNEQAAEYQRHGHECHQDAEAYDAAHHGAEAGADDLVGHAADDLYGQYGVQRVPQQGGLPDSPPA